MEPARDYYVTMRRAQRTAWLAGPFQTHAEALALVDTTRREAAAVDPWTHFDAFGTASLVRDPGNPVGKLNGRIFHGERK
jgi:hypothetical protein